MVSKAHKSVRTQTPSCTGGVSSLGFGCVAEHDLQKLKSTARVRSLLPVDLRLQRGREFDQRDTCNRPVARTHGRQLAGSRKIFTFEVP